MIKAIVKKISNYHKNTGEENILIITMPRSGSTWLMEIISSQPKIKYFSEPFNLRINEVKKTLGIYQWKDLYNHTNEHKIINYLSKAVDGKIGFFNPNPFGKYYKPYTNRIVFKIIHFGEHNIKSLSEAINGKTILMLRHPMAVIISRKQLPRINVFLEVPEIANKFSDEQIKLANQIIQQGTFLEKSTLSWCIQNQLSLQSLPDKSLIVFYEDIVINPKHNVKLIKDFLKLIHQNDMNKVLTRQSMVKHKSDDTTQKIFINSRTQLNKHKLISKWRDKISKDDEASLFDIIKTFNVSFYTKNNFMPTNKSFYYTK